jgi:hypothetical protein
MIRFLFTSFAGFTLLGLGGLAFAEEARKVVFDFESGDLQGWQIVQGSFFKPVGDREFYVNHPQLKYNKQGKHYLATVEHPNGTTTNRPTGVIESPVFVLAYGKISLLVGGGSHDNTYIALCTEDGKEVFHARGKNTEVFQPVTWDAGALIGERIFLKAVDLHTGGWGYIALDNFRAQGRLDSEATKSRFALHAERARQERIRAIRTHSRQLREAMEDLAATFGDRYPKGPEFLARLDQLLQRADEATVEDVEGIQTELESLRHQALTANPLVSGQPILFVTRAQYYNEHGTEATMYQTGEINTWFFRGGGAMKIIDFAEGGEVNTVIDVPQGIVRDPEVGFDGDKIVFSMRHNIEDDYHIYEMNVDGSGLKQLTTGSRLSDIQPVCMPDGKIVFSSTREPKYIPCQRHLMANLFEMNADGSNIRQLGHNTQFEGHGSLMPDGRVLYTRWEYVDKHYASAYGLWTMNPDGTNQCLYYGGYAWQPSAVIDARIIPGTEKFVCIYTTVHNLPFGAMVVADRRRGLDGTEPILKSWPADISQYMSHWDKVDRVGAQFDSFMWLPVRYEDPYPLSEKYFLCARSINQPQGNAPVGTMGLFLVDTFGNEVLLHVEAPGCFDPMLIVARRRTPKIPTRVDLAADEGTFYVQDVYAGEWMADVRRGSVKFLRIIEAPPKKTFAPRGIGDWTPALNIDGHHPVAVNWDHYNHKRILGKVPVEADGSAYFSVPAGRFVYFQLLDEQDMMIHSMRSGTTVQPGETAGCIGCHESRLQSVPVRSNNRLPLALRRPPSQIEPWYGPPRNFSYTVEVQPVWDKHCISCHDYGKEASELNLSGDRGPAFNVSYTMLRSRGPAVWTTAQPDVEKPLISSVGAGPVQAIPPYSWGSHRSRLIDILREGHYDVKLDREDFERIVTWIDLNTPYYPSHVTYYQTNTFGRCPLDHKHLARLGQLVAAAPHGSNYGWNKVNVYAPRQLTQRIMTLGSPINFTRPQRSLCLKAFTDKNDPAYREALSIIQSGRQMLQQHPRADMPNFRPCEADQRRVDYHAKRREIEAHNRRTIAQGDRIYDAHE